MNWDSLRGKLKYHVLYPGYAADEYGNVYSFYKSIKGICLISSPKILKGNIDHNGYLVHNFKHISGIYKTVKRHRFIWECFNELIDNDKIFIDHIDRNKLNNNIENLRLCNNFQNQRNILCKWERYCKRRKKYLVQPSVNGKRCFIGWFENKEDARKAFIKFYYEFDSIFYSHLKNEYDTIDPKWNPQG